MQAHKVRVDVPADHRIILDLPEGFPAGPAEHFHAPERLGAAAREAMAEVDEGTSLVWVPAVVMAEAIMVAERGRIAGLTVDALISQLEVLETRKTTACRR